MRPHLRIAALSTAILLVCSPIWAQGKFTLEQVMDFPFPTSLTAAAQGQHIAWTADLRGVRNVYVGDGPDFVPRQVTHYTEDDGQPIAAVRITPDGKTVVYARGSEHNSIGDTADPDSSADKPDQHVWAVRQGGAPKLLGDMGCSSEDCEDIEMSPDGQWVVWPARQTIWIAPVSGSTPVKAMAWSQGNNTMPRWSPDSKRVAFVTNRPGHSFIAIYEVGSQHLRYLSPSVDRDSYPRWSPDGTQIVFVRERGVSRSAPPPVTPGEPESLQPAPSNVPPIQMPRWELWIADLATLQAHPFWHSGIGADAGIYNTPFGDSLNVGANHMVMFSAEFDGWNHLYSVSDEVHGDVLNKKTLLTPGQFETEHVAMMPDGLTAIVSSNQDDIDRRHLWKVSLSGNTAPEALTKGQTMEWTPVITGDGKQVLCLGSTATTPAMPYLITSSGRKMLGQLPPDFPATKLVTPKQVVFPSADNFQIHGQLFIPTDAGPGPLPALIFVHGGSQRQMMLGFHYMDYYHNAYAENQYLANLGFVVLSVNYRTGIMYGRAFRTAPQTGRAGARECNDVVAAARYLLALPQVDAHKLGIWGGSYGGFLTAMALARNSDMFAAGVDFHGVHDWSTLYAGGGPVPANLAAAAGRGGGRGPAAPGRGTGDNPTNPSGATTAASAATMEGGGGGRGEGGAPGPGQPGNLAFDSSPDAYVTTWRSPVLLIQGDDDRNVDFGQMIDLVDRLRGQKVPFEQIVIPDEIHGFLRWASWLRGYTATADFFERVLVKGEKISLNN